MKISPNIERGVHILLILALADKESVVSSQILSRLLEESDSSVKKLLSKLSKADLISAREGKEGGFTLKRELSQISLLDTWQAIENPLFQYELSSLAERIFTLPEQVEVAKERLTKSFQVAQSGFEAELSHLTLDQLLVEDFAERSLDWKKLLEERKYG